MGTRLLCPQRAAFVQPEAQRPTLTHLRNKTSKGHNGESQKLGHQALSRQQVDAFCRSNVFRDSTMHGWVANSMREQRGGMPLPKGSVVTHCVTSRIKNLCSAVQVRSCFLPPPRVTIRQRPGSKTKTGSTQQMAALSTITPCGTHCGRPVA